MKGISPFIAVVLLIAFVVSVGMLMFTWTTGYFKTTGERISGTGEKATRCVFTNIDVDSRRLEYDFSGGPPETLRAFVTNIGKEDLYNFTFIIITSEGTWEFEPTNQRTKTNPLKGGESERFEVISDVDITGKFQTLRIRVTCLDMKITNEIPIIE